MTRAEAAATYMVDYVRPKALLQLDGIEQSVSFLYNYTGVKSASTDASAQQFQERYHFGTGFTILDPSILQITLSSDLGLNQSLPSEGSLSNSLTWDYLFTANALQYDPYPVSVTSGRVTTQVATAYLPTYTATTNSNQLWLRLLNKTVPLSLHYSRTSLDTSGLSQDSSSTNDSVALSASHNYRDRSVSDLSLGYSGSHSSVSAGSSESTKNYTFSGSNTTSIDQANRYSLGTYFNFSEAKQGDVPSTSASFSENLNAILGKTLQGRATYQHSYNTTVAFDGSEQTQTSDSLAAVLTHQLFESLSTNVSGNYQNQKLSGGDESDYGGGVSLSYQKRLPANSLLRLGVTGNRNYVDRSGDVSQISVRDELHRNVQQGDLIALTSPGNLGSVISVRSRNPELSYLEGRDYIVSLPLSRIEIIPGGTIVPGTDILISYTLVQNPTVKYYTDSTGVSSSLSLRENRYVFSGDYSVQSQHQISGRTDSLSLFDSKQFHLRFDGNFVENSFVAEYGNTDSGQTKYWYTQGSWRYQRALGLSDVTFSVADRYTYFDATDTSDAYSQNEFTTAGSLSRPVFSWGRVTLSANYANSAGDNRTSNFAFLRANLLGRFNQLTFGLTGQTGVRISKGEISRNESVVVSVTRSF